MTRRHSRHVRLVTRFAKIPEVVADGRVRCICGRALALTPNGHLREHNMPNGDPCAHRATYTQPTVVEVPEATTSDDVARPTAKRRTPPPRLPAKPSRLDAGSLCEDCGKWLPGERRLCGRCYVHRRGIR